VAGQPAQAGRGSESSKYERAFGKFKTRNRAELGWFLPVSRTAPVALQQQIRTELASLN
jgi:hypothetical protein